MFNFLGSNKYLATGMWIHSAPAMMYQPHMEREFYFNVKME